jgi:hypothetical protein
MTAYRNQADYWHRGTRLTTGLPNPIVLGRKFCARCGHWRHVCDFAPRSRNTGSGLDSYCRACNRMMNREAYARQTPEQRERQREYWRIWREAKARAAGVPRSKGKRHTVIDRPEYRFLPAAPLVERIQYDLAHPEPGTMTGDPGFGIEGLAARAGVPARSIDRLLRGESKHVRLDLADKLCFGLGVPLYLVFGEEPLISFYPTQMIDARRQSRQDAA